MGIVQIELRSDGTRTVPSAPTASEGSLKEAASREPTNGVYLVTRTWGGRVLELDAHFDRMERSAATLGHALHVPRRRIRAALAELRGMLEQQELSASDQGGGAAVGAAEPPSRRGVDGRFRVTAVLDDTPRYLLSMEPAADVPREAREHGVVCRIAPNTARTDATVKSTVWMVARDALLGGANPPYEYLLTNAQGEILEGATSNFWAVRRGARGSETGSVLHTAGAGVLEGIARRIVLAVAAECTPPLDVELTPVTVADVTSGAVREAFITSASRGIVPVCRIDDTALDAPGTITARLDAAYQGWMQRHLEPLV